MRMGPGKHLKGLTLMNGLVKPEEFDYFHEVHYHLDTRLLAETDSSMKLIITQELTRCGARGYGDGTHRKISSQSSSDSFTGLLGGKVIGLPPVLNFGSDELKAKVVPEVLSGKKFICLAVSEAYAGSDVMGLQTTATKSEDGKEWIINGTFAVVFLS